MIQYPAGFAAANSAAAKDPRFTVEVAFDNANTDLWYLTSHKDCEVPPGAVNILYGCLQQPSGTSQRLSPLKAAATIGSMTIPAVDGDGQITAYIGAKLATVNGVPSGDGLRGKRLRVYIGYAGLPWTDYVLPPGGTQLIQKITYDKGLYTFLCNDVQRSARKNIFELRATTLTANISATDSTITVARADDFEMMAHDSAYGDAPNSTVGYLKVEDEVVRYTDVSPGVGTLWEFTGCVRGVLGTLAKVHEVDLTADEDRRTEVEEYVYLQGPIIKVLYAILTGNLWGQPGETLPSNWHLGIDTAYVATSQFTGVGYDLWNPSNPQAGFQCRGQGLKKVDGKKFYETELALLAGCFLPVTSTGELGLRRMSSVLHDASHVVLLDNSNVVSVGPLTHDMDQVHNQFNINWNWAEEKFTRGSTLIDQGSISTHGAAVPLDMKFQMLHGSTSTQANLAMVRDSARDRYTGPPELVTVSCLHKLNAVEIGDIVRLETDQIRDYVSSSDISRAFEVQQARVNWGTGDVSLTLFGSSQRADLIASSELNTVLDNTFYGAASGGTNISTVTTGFLATGVWHITADVTLSGASDMTAAGAIFYYEGGVQVDPGVTVTLVDNVQFRFRDSFTHLGTSITGVGGSTANHTVTTGLGATESMGGLQDRVGASSNLVGIYEEGPGESATAIYSSVPELRLENNGSTLAGLPADLRGIASPPGTDNSHWNQGGPVGPFVATGGPSATGGAGLLIISRSVYGQPGSVIDLSGAGGTLGGSDSVTSSNGTIGGLVPAVFYAGSSSGAAPGGLVIMLDGVNAVEAAFVHEFTARQGAMPWVGEPLPSILPLLSVYRSKFIGSLYLPVNHAASNSRIINIPANETAVGDVSEYADVPTAISIQESNGTNNTLNVTALELSVTPPAAGNYVGANLYIKDSTTESWKPVGFASGTEELVFYVPKAVNTYQVRANPVAISGRESSEYALETITLSADAGMAVIGPGNRIATSPTVGDALNGQGIELSTAGLFGYNSTGVAKFALDPATGVLTAVDGIFSGSVTATSGAIGGWSISAGAMTAGGLVLDSANTRIRAGTGGNYTEMSATGFVASSDTLGVTVNFPSSGATPTISSGVINETEYNIITSDTAIKIGSATGYLTGDGFFAGREAGVSKMHVGNPISRKYLAFDGTNVVLGRDTELLGADAYNNSTVYFHTFFDSIEPLNPVTSGTGSVTVGSFYLEVYSGAGGTDFASVRRALAFTDSALFWEDRRIKFRAQLWSTSSTLTGSDFEMQTGNSFDYVGFRIRQGVVYAVASYAGLLTDININTTLTMGDYLFEIAVIGGAASYYIDGAIVGHVVTNIPPPTFESGNIFRLRAGRMSSGPPCALRLSELRFLSN